MRVPPPQKGNEREYHAATPPSYVLSRASTKPPLAFLLGAGAPNIRKRHHADADVRRPLRDGYAHTWSLSDDDLLDGYVTVAHD